MENKPKVFKTLVHKETGEWGEIQDHKAYPSGVPDLFYGEETYNFLEDKLDFDGHEFKEVVVIPLEEYELLIQYKEGYESLK